MSRPVRVLLVTLGLVAAGAVFGAIAGALAVVISLVLTEGPESAAVLGLYVVGAYFGAFIGAVLLPVVAWIVLRHVPLGRAIVGSVIGTVVGGVGGWLVPVIADEVIRGLLGAAAGMLGAAIVMWQRFKLKAGATVTS